MLIDEDTPSLEYKAKDNPGIRNNKYNYKSGQRKLFVTEIRFLTEYSYLSDSVLYVGSAPGHHLNSLIIAFPNIKRWIFYDPEHTRVSTTIKDVSIEVYEELFTIEHAKSYKEESIIFICDIRSYESTEMGAKIPVELADKTIKEDMQKQKEWVQAGEFIISSLKFRLTWEKDINTIYFDGELHTQPWTGEYSPELRLFTDGKKYKEYNNKKIDNQMYWYNSIKRIELYPQLVDAKYKQIDYDQLIECNIIKEYLRKIQKKEAHLLDDITYLFINLNCTRYRATYRN